jgi:periplasmic protein TonB
MDSAADSTGVSESSGRAVVFLRANGPGIGAAVVLVSLAVLAARWIAHDRGAPAPPRKVMQYTMVRPQPAPVAKPPPPPPPVAQPKIAEQPQTTRVELKAQDFAPPDAAKPAPGPAGGGRLSLAAEGEGAGDQFNLVGNPGGRGLLSGGGLGDGSGDGLGEGGGGAGARFGWYYAKVAVEIEDAFRRLKNLSTAATRVELRVWIDETGRIGQVRLIHTTGDAQLDQAIQSIVGLKLRDPPPIDLPMPMIARLTARRPQ